MSALYWHFPVSGVETWLWLPPLVAFGLSFFCSMVGISGAFLLMPFQMSVLGYVSPSVSATNLVFNLFATPGGVWRYVREGRMFWPLAALVVLGTLPGVVLGFYLRVLYLPDVSHFKLFVGLVLIFLSWRLLAEFAPWAAQRPPAAAPTDMALRILHVGFRRVAFSFHGQEHGFSTPAMLTLALVVGVIGGTYGIGGGAIIAPFCITIFRLPVHMVAGAALAGTFATSVIGVAVYTFLPLPGGANVPTGTSAAPDWWLGSLFGLGGLVGMYLGAACQRHIPQRVLKGALGVLLAGLGASYIY